MPVIASPSTCTDTANIWTPWIKEITGIGYDATKYKLSIDIAAKKNQGAGPSDYSGDNFIQLCLF